MKLLSAATTSEIDYDHAWESRWDDMRHYGPTGRHSRRIVRAMIEPLKFSSLLDVGCGSGSLIAELRRWRPGVRYSGVDFSAQAVETARQRDPEGEFFELDLTRDHLGRRFDLVLCTDVVEHIVDDTTAIANLAAMTKHHLLISTLQGRMRSFETSVGHVRNYHPGELEEKLEAAGLEIERVVAWGYPIYSPLYRNLLNQTGGKGTEGRYGFGRKLIAQVIYQLFRLNSWQRGDYLFVLARQR